MAGGAFDKVVTKVYVDEQATVEAVKKAGELLKNAGVDDTFVLFIAGHGVHDSDKAGTYYYLTHEADVKRLAETAAPFDLVEGLLQAAPARNKFFLMDTCESGEQDEAVETAFLERAKGAGLSARTTRAITIKAREGAAEVKQTRAYLLDRDRFIFNDLFRRSGAVVFSSSRGSEFSYESDAAGNGYFTECILAGLGRARGQGQERQDHGGGTPKLRERGGRQDVERPPAPDDRPGQLHEHRGISRGEVTASAGTAKPSRA